MVRGPTGHLSPTPAWLRDLAFVAYDGPRGASLHRGRQPAVGAPRYLLALGSAAPRACSAPRPRGSAAHAARPQAGRPAPAPWPPAAPSRGPAAPAGAPAPAPVPSPARVPALSPARAPFPALARAPSPARGLLPAPARALALHPAVACGEVGGGGNGRCAGAGGTRHGPRENSRGRETSTVTCATTADAQASAFMKSPRDLKSPGPSFTARAARARRLATDHRAARHRLGARSLAPVPPHLVGEQTADTSGRARP